MTHYLCPDCGGVIETEYSEMADVYKHWCVDCDREFETVDMLRHVFDGEYEDGTANIDRFTRHEQALDELDDNEQ